MRVTRRSFNKLFGIAVASLSTGFMATKSPKIVGCDVKMSYYPEYIYGIGQIGEYVSDNSKPEINVSVHFDDGETLSFTAEDSKWVIEEPRHKKSGKMYGGALMGENHTLIINLDGGRYELIGLKEVGRGRV